MHNSVILRKIYTLLILFFAFSFLGNTLAQNADIADSVTVAPTIPADLAAQKERFKKNLAAIGVTYTQDDEKIDVVVDQKKAVDALPLLASQGVIPKIADKDIKKSPLALSVGVVGISFTIVIMNTIFTENSAFKKMHVNTYIVPTGSTTKELCFSYDYDRSLFAKMNLDTLTPKDFIINTPGFMFTQWCRGNMDKEVKK